MRVRPEQLLYDVVRDLLATAGSVVELQARTSLDRLRLLMSTVNLTSLSVTQNFTSECSFGDSFGISG